MTKLKLLTLCIFFTTGFKSFAETNESLSPEQVKQVQAFLESFKNGVAPTIKPYPTPPKENGDWDKFDEERTTYGEYRKKEIDPIFKSALSVLQTNPPAGMKIELANDVPSEIVVRTSAKYYKITNAEGKVVYVLESNMDAFGRFAVYDSFEIQRIQKSYKELEEHTRRKTGSTTPVVTDGVLAAHEANQAANAVYQGQLDSLTQESEKARSQQGVSTEQIEAKRAALRTKLLRSQNQSN